MKKSWIILLVLIINLFFAVLINAEENITFIYPKNVEVGKEFEVKIILINFSEDIYDVKIDILNGSINLAKRFWDGSWEYNRWIYNAIDTSKTDNSIFKLNVTKDYNGLTNITIKVRENGKTNLIIERDYQINITYNSNPLQNNTQNPVQNNNSNQKTLISLNIDWNDDEIINGDEFDIEIDVENLNKNKNYDIKVWIEFEDNNTVISQIYNEEDKWISSNNYYNKFFENVVNKTKEIKLRVKQNYRNYYGDAVIKLRLRETGSSSYIKEISKDIEILEKKEKTEVKNSSKEIKITTKSDESTSFISGEVIKLGGSESKETITNNQKNTNNNIIYESKTEKMKVYAIIGFAVLCLGLVILVLFNKLN